MCESSTSLILRPVACMQMKVKWPNMSLLPTNGCVWTRTGLSSRDVILLSQHERSVHRSGDNKSPCLTPLFLWKSFLILWIVLLSHRFLIIFTSFFSAPAFPVHSSWSFVLSAHFARIISVYTIDWQLFPLFVAYPVIPQKSYSIIVEKFAQLAFYYTLGLQVILKCVSWNQLARSICIVY